jgi:hypothetical protein
VSDEAIKEIEQERTHKLIGRTLPGETEEQRDPRILQEALFDSLDDELAKAEKEAEPIEIGPEDIKEIEEPEEEEKEERRKAAATRLQLLRSLAEEKTVEHQGDALDISEALLDDLITSLKGTKKSVDNQIDKLEKSKSDVPKEDIESVRNFTGNTALLCNMILNGKGYSREDRRKAILDLAG